jgi:hypothetical protein
MSELYNRHTKLVVYAGLQKTVFDKVGEDYLHVDFDIETFAGTGKKSNPNTAKIVIYNLNESHRGLFTEEHQAIEFYAGYGDDIGLIFVGETTNVINRKVKTPGAAPYWETTIYAGDGIKDWTTRTFSKSYSAGTPVSIVLQDMIATTELPSVIDIFEDSMLLAGESYSGLVKDVLNDFTADRGLEWSIQWGVIEVTQKDSPLIRDPTAILLRPDTGMVGSPALIERTTSGKRKATKKKRLFGLRVTSLMNHQIKPKRLIKIESGSQINAVGKLTSKPAPKTQLNGVYIAKNVRYYGSNHSGEYYTEIEADLQ